MYVSELSFASLASDGGGEHIDPTEDEILATTDTVNADGVTQRLPQGTYAARITITATNLDAASAICEIRHLGVDGDPVERVVVCAPVDQCWQYDVVFSLEKDESIVVAPYLTGFLGTVWAAINYQKVR